MPHDVKAMRAALTKSGFEMIERLEPEKCEMWAKDCGDTNVHLQDDGYFQDIEVETGGFGLDLLQIYLTEAQGPGY